MFHSITDWEDANKLQRSLSKTKKFKIKRNSLQTISTTTNINNKTSNAIRLSTNKFSLSSLLFNLFQFSLWSILFLIIIIIIITSTEAANDNGSFGRQHRQIITKRTSTSPSPSLFNNNNNNKTSSKLMYIKENSDNSSSSSSLSSSRNNGIIVHRHSSSNRIPSIRHRFEFVSNLKPINTIGDDDDNVTNILMPHNLEELRQIQQQQRWRTQTTFRPSSSVLYLHPPKPRHIESIESVLTTLNLTSTQIIVGWKLMIRLRANDTGFSLLSRARRKVEEAKVEEETNPLQYNIYLRRYGFTNRQKFSIVDRNNTLDPPVTNNQSYHYQLDNLELMNSYEFCLQSVNGGEVHETEEIRRQFPVNAQTELAGRNNPLFLCKEIVMPAPESFTLSGSISEGKVIDRLVSRSQNLEQTPRSFDTGIGRKSGSNLIEVSDDTADAFVLYTAITTGSTTVLILVIIVIFCCCRCRRNIQKQNHHRTLVYDRHQTTGMATLPAATSGSIRSSTSSTTRDKSRTIIVPYSGFQT